MYHLPRCFISLSICSRNLDEHPFLVISRDTQLMPDRHVALVNQSSSGPRKCSSSLAAIAMLCALPRGTTRAQFKQHYLPCCSDIGEDDLHGSCNLQFQRNPTYFETNRRTQDGVSTRVGRTSRFVFASCSCIRKISSPRSFLNLVVASLLMCGGSIH